MNKLYYCKVRDVKNPTRGHSTDAGIDFFIPNDIAWETYTIPPLGSVLIPSGIRMNVPPNTMLVAMNKSSIAIEGLIVGACVVDSGYSGEIHIHLINTSKGYQTIKRGQKIVQFILTPILVHETEEIQEAYFLKYYDSSSRGSGGFGSTGSV